MNCQKIKGTLDYFGELSNKKRFVEGVATSGMKV